MVIKIYDLEDLRFKSDEEISVLVLDKLKETGNYDSTNMYRGLTTTNEGLRRIKRDGTDRDSSRQNEQILQQLEMAGTYDDETRELATWHTDPTKIWAAEEERLPEIINKYANTSFEEDPKKFPLILVYRRDCLEEDISDFYGFKEGVKPLDAIVAGVRFRD